MAGIRRPQEGRWDLMFQTFLFLLLLISGLCLALLTLIVFMAWNIRLNLDTGAPADVHVFLPQVSWTYYALITALILTASVLLLRRLFAAWKNRSRHARG
jgi:membrane protein implicated in regulation of membrane protease activity